MSDIIKVALIKDMFAIYSHKTGIIFTTVLFIQVFHMSIFIMSAVILF